MKLIYSDIIVTAKLIYKSQTDQSTMLKFDVVVLERISISKMKFLSRTKKFSLSQLVLFLFCLRQDIKQNISN